MEKGRVKTLKYIAALNFRICREVKGCADQVMPFLIRPGGSRPYHTMILSSPRGGKTTLLRDIIRQLSNGIPSLNFDGINVAVVDERSEIAGCYQGIPQNDVGLRTDVLDNCPKAEGMLMVLRAMSPQVIATDEIGSADDVNAVAETVNAGVAVIVTAHAASLEEIEQRPTLRPLITQGIFERLVFLSRARGPGTIEAIVDGRSRINLLTRTPAGGRVNV